MVQPPVRNFDALSSAPDTPSARALRLIALSSGASVVVFFFVLALLPSETWSGSTPAAETFFTTTGLSIAHVLTAMGIYGILPFLSRRIGGPDSEGVHSREHPGTLGESFNRFQRAYIVRLAMMEAVALFGLIVCFVALSQGTLQHQPLYWLNAASSAIFVGFLAATFPSDTRVAETLMENVSKDTPPRIS